MITAYMGRPLDKMARQSGLHCLAEMWIHGEIFPLTKSSITKTGKGGRVQVHIIKVLFATKMVMANTPLIKSFICTCGDSFKCSEDVIRHQHASWTWILPPFTVLAAELFVGGEISPCIHISARQCNPDHLPILSRNTLKDTIAYHFWMGG